jgi:hypothetical protein
MRSHEIVEVKIAIQALISLAWAGIIIQIHLLILDRSPKAFGEDIVTGPPAAIHADLNTGGEQALDVGRTGEVTALVAVLNHRSSMAQGSVDRFQNERHFQGLVQFPGDHKTGKPIQDGHQVHPTRALVRFSP